MSATPPLWKAALLLALSPAAWAQQACSSDGLPAPTALLERFTSADCETCWSDPQAAQPGAGTVALDWIVPGAQGDEAPLSAAARQDGLDRLQALGQAQSPETAQQPSKALLRVARGPALGGYIGTSIELQPTGPIHGPLTAWLALVETIAAGTDGTPVERNLVRNTLVLDWNAAAGSWKEIRPLAVPEGAQAARLRVIGWVEDASARVLAAAQSQCQPEPD
nr:hypothetical protein [uncultured Albidiferax sp.]